MIMWRTRELMPVLYGNDKLNERKIVSGLLLLAAWFSG